MIRCLSNLPVDITAVLAAACKVGMQLDTNKSALATCDGTDEADGARHVARHIDDIAHLDILSAGGTPKAAGGKRGRHDVGVFAGQNLVVGVGFTIIRNAGQRVLRQGGDGAFAREQLGHGRAEARRRGRVCVVDLVEVGSRNGRETAATVISPRQGVAGGGVVC